MEILEIRIFLKFLLNLEIQANRDGDVISVAICMECPL